jgi:hypothetical protein
MLSRDPRLEGFKYRTIKPHQWTHDPVMDKYAPDHRLAYRVRTNIMSNQSSYRPICICGHWGGKWRGSRNDQSRREFQSLHLAALGRQLRLPGTAG